MFTCRVGILAATEFTFVLDGTFRCNAADKLVTGEQKVTQDSCTGEILWREEKVDYLCFKAAETDKKGVFEVKGVVIGKGFHWERKEDQRFTGDIEFVTDEQGQLWLVNKVGIEDYLMSVISSEMSANAPLELLKAHAIISRCWILRQQDRKAISSALEAQKELRQSEKPEFSICSPLQWLKLIYVRRKKKRNVTAMMTTAKKYFSLQLNEHLSKEQPLDTSEELIRWYDSEGHTAFDVCADDHCQRYQGISKALHPNVIKAVKETYMKFLVEGGNICDARFSKCCGGATEEYHVCWDNKQVNYLQSFRDGNIYKQLPDLTDETEAEKWIRSMPESFCKTRDKHILSSVLNNYDQETIDFYRWKVEYTQQELSDLIRVRTGIDYGNIVKLEPLARGKSGRIYKLRIVGSKYTRIIGKELEIRRTLSPTHLYSSAFVVDKVDDKFILTGAGWGHGVGLCQIGAAVMSDKGYKYDEILKHYYPGAYIVDIS